MVALPCSVRGAGTGQLLGLRLSKVAVVATSLSNVDLTLNREASLPLYGRTLRSRTRVAQVRTEGTIVKYGLHVENAPVINDAPEVSSAFSVHLNNFDGPFDLLLQLISRHRMDITEVALSAVTDEFISFIRALEASGEGWKLDQATEFLVVAATLLDLKAARLLPSGEVEDETDLALLEARDLLFARLLQYRAF